MKREGKQVKMKDELGASDLKNANKIMSSNLPLLFANGRPRSLETISQPELEDFVPFMILCSLGVDLDKKPKQFEENCPVPEWWPQGFPFKFPLLQERQFINRQVMLKSLVCRCYTFYGCEFLLKFSSDLADMSPSNLKFVENTNEKTTSIFDSSGAMLVKCRNENLNYDMHKNSRRYLSPTHRSTLNHVKTFEPVIDLTFDTSSEDEKEVYFKEVVPASDSSAKRKLNIESSSEPVAKQRCLRSMFIDFPDEVPEPAVHNQDEFMAKFQLLPQGTQVVKDELKVERKKKLAHSFAVICISSIRGQELLKRNKHSVNVEACLERINRHCGPNPPEEEENNQTRTRSSVIVSAIFKNDENENWPKPKLSNENSKWNHVYKWPHRTHNPRYPYIGPCIKPCVVRLARLSQESILFWTKQRCSAATTTPKEWWRGDQPICGCQKIPLIDLDDDLTDKFKTKSSSTRCTCTQPKSLPCPGLQAKKNPVEVKSTSNLEMQLKSGSKSSTKARQRNTSKSLSRGSGGFHISGTGFTRSSVIQSFSDDKEGTVLYTSNTLHQRKSPVDFKRALHRRPLAVVPPTLVIDKGISGVLCRPVICVPQNTISTSSVKISFYRSILDAIKWYTKDDPASEPLGLLSKCIVQEGLMLSVSQENIKPLTELILPNSKKPFDYFDKNVNHTERDYCFVRSSDGSSKLVTRRGERHYSNREPCPPCFHGRDNFCVYEFIRQAKLAGVNLHKNKKQLQVIFFKFIQAVNSKA